MLLDVFRMPTAFGIPINRRYTLCNQPVFSAALLEPVITWPFLPLPHASLIVGSYVCKTPMNLCKAIYVSLDGLWIFEAVFSIENAQCVCLYTKIISTSGVDIGISLNAVKFYCVQPRSVVPIWQFLDNGISGDVKVTALQKYDNDNTNSLRMENIVPPIFSLDSLANILRYQMSSIGTVAPRLDSRIIYRPLYDHVPAVLEAMLGGEFYRPPFQEIASFHPNYTMTHDPWSYYEQFVYKINHQGLEAFVNHPAFDEIILSIVKLSVVKISITTTFAFAIDVLQSLWLTKEYSDPYQIMLQGYSFNQDNEQKQLSLILHDIAMMYCRLHSIDYTVFMKTCQEKSSITLSKNEYDEVSITIHDIIHDRYVCYYASFPAIALATLSIGSHQL